MDDLRITWTELSDGKWENETGSIGIHRMLNGNGEVYEIWKRRYGGDGYAWYPARFMVRGLDNAKRIAELS